MYKYCVIIFLGLLLPYRPLAAQEVTPRGTFATDSIKIGMSIPYSLSIRYPLRMDVVFPDSSYDYSPFELDRKQYFPTTSDSTSSYDSAVYYLSTFEIDSIQYLQLPVYFVNSGDSIPVYAKRDSVFLVELVSVLPDSINLIENTAYTDVATQFNYPYLLLALGILLIVTLLILILFGGRIRKLFRIRRLKAHHHKFLTTYDKLIKQAGSDGSIAEKEHTAFVWKKYVEKLEKLPITKLTTKEIMSNLQPKEEVVEALKNIDQALYSKRVDKPLATAYSVLREEAIIRFQNKIASVKEHG